MKKSWKEFREKSRRKLLKEFRENVGRNRRRIQEEINEEIF